ncbi:hypothetical protein GGR53DRAFT_529976 [Hypoxylon sp. FL1150]|nr:hypothetical protein GGR53DRAFT_529976 [Hypoxylon sp. FL1150]
MASERSIRDARSIRVARSVRDARPSEERPTRGSNAFASPDNCPPFLGLGKRKRESDEDEAPPGDFMYSYLATHYELDEHDIIRGMHMDPYNLGGGKIHRFKTPGDPKGTGDDTNQPPIQWRCHGEVAIEVTEYKRALVLHDLVDDANTHLMVFDKDHCIIQGTFNEPHGIRNKVIELLGVPRELIYLGITVVSGMEACRQRAAIRRGGLVDVKSNYLPMDWGNAERLMAKEFSGIGNLNLVLMEFRLMDPSPPRSLKPGRRLVPTKMEDVVLVEGDVDLSAPTWGDWVTIPPSSRWECHLY